MVPWLKLTLNVVFIRLDASNFLVSQTWYSKPLKVAFYNFLHNDLVYCGKLMPGNVAHLSINSIDPIFRLCLCNNKSGSSSFICLSKHLGWVFRVVQAFTRVYLWEILNARNRSFHGGNVLLSLILSPLAYNNSHSAKTMSFVFAGV